MLTSTTGKSSQHMEVAESADGEAAEHYEEEPGEAPALEVAAEVVGDTIIDTSAEHLHEITYAEEEAALALVGDSSLVGAPGEEEPVKKRRRGQGTSVPRWTPDEEERLRQLVAECGERDWAKVAEKLQTNRSAAGVDQHWCALRALRKPLAAHRTRGKPSTLHTAHRRRSDWPRALPVAMHRALLRSVCPRARAGQRQCGLLTRVRYYAVVPSRRVV